MILSITRPQHVSRKIARGNTASNRRPVIDKNLGNPLSKLMRFLIDCPIPGFFEIEYDDAGHRSRVQEPFGGVGVHIDEPRRHAESLGIDDDISLRVGEPAHRDDLAPENIHIGPIPRVARTIENEAISGQGIETFLSNTAEANVINKLTIRTTDRMEFTFERQSVSENSAILARCALP